MNSDKSNVYVFVNKNEISGMKCYRKIPKISCFNFQFYNHPGYLVRTQNNFHSNWDSLLGCSC